VVHRLQQDWIGAGVTTKHPFERRAERVVASIKAKLQDGRKPDAIDIVYRELDDLLLHELFDEASVLLSAFAKSELPLALLMSVLIASKPWRNEFRKPLAEISVIVKATATGDDARDIAPLLVEDA